jgi:hypothetical protein
VSFEFFTIGFFAHLYLYPETVVVALTFEQATPLLIFAAADAGTAETPPAIRTAERKVNETLRNMSSSNRYVEMISIVPRDLSVTRQ